MTDLIEPNIFVRHVTADDSIRSPLATQVINEIATGQRCYPLALRFASSRAWGRSGR